MKRRLSCFLVIIVLISCLIVSASASGTTARLNYVTDLIELLPDEQTRELEKRAESISSEYGIGVYIYIVQNYRSFSGSSKISDAAIDIYRQYLLGWGNDCAGTMLMLSMADRDYNLDFNSKRADAVFTEVGRDWMEDEIVDHLRNDDYYGAFSAYLDLCEQYMAAARDGHPVGEGETYQTQSYDIGLIPAIIIGVIASVLTGIFMVLPMKTARKKTDANQYAAQEGIHLTNRSDMFLRRSVTRVPRQTKSSGASSHSTHYSSGSHSGRSGKF